EAAKKTAPYIAQTAHNMYFGYDDLAACELAFYKNHLKTAKKCAHEAILKARAANQHSIEVMAAFYLFRIASAEGDYAQIKELFKNKDDSPGNPNFWNRRFLYELAIGFLYAHIGLPQMMPSWLLTEEKDSVFEVSIPARELICGAKYYFAAKKYSQALTLLCNSYPRKKQERFLLGELTLMLLSAVARIKTGDEIGAARDFDTAYEKSFDGVFEMPFVELGRELPPLASALRRAGSKIPDWWLKMIGRKASIYAKKLTVVTNAFKEEQRIKDTVQLSERETEVLNDLYHGLSREEIAANRYLSINTVKKVLQSIFIKLDANNSVDAIRIGLENKLIE
ncbi:MAG: LuxR C-terminal-related transcriptional regulator, partial [Oscillospiraceae bacterium]|nr:LuxR C-terminal-related transcriptional regulator [Oscillospiraceae bacterium]